ncbi:MAG: hypothetical protein IKB08_00315 [Clostridia bacterium]|nr:hypothetical protein [Clostridia bacterium]
MTIQNVINRVTAIRNEKKCTNDFVIDQMNNLEWKIKREIIDVHEGAENHPFTGYTAGDLDVKLIAPEPYSELYIKWVIYQLDILNNSVADAANSYVLFQEIYDDFRGWYKRNHMPLFRGNITSKGYHI